MLSLVNSKEKVAAPLVNPKGNALNLKEMAAPLLNSKEKAATLLNSKGKETTLLNPKEMVVTLVDSRGKKASHGNHL